MSMPQLIVPLIASGVLAFTFAGALALVGNRPLGQSLSFFVGAVLAGIGLALVFYGRRNADGLFCC